MVICAISTIILLFTIALFMLSLVSYALPEYKHAGYLTSYNSNEQYVKNFTESLKKSNISPFDQSGVEKQRIEAKKYQIESYTNNAISDMINYAIWIFTASLFLLVHSHIYRKNNQ